MRNYHDSTSFIKKIVLYNIYKSMLNINTCLKLRLTTAINICKDNY